MLRSFTCLVALFLLVSCNSDKHSSLVNECSKNFYQKEHFDPKTGERITQTSHLAIFSLVLKVCSVKVDLYEQGYRVNPIVEAQDFLIYINADSSGLKEHYKQKLRCEADREECVSQNNFEYVMACLLGIVVIYCLTKFGYRVYQSYFKKSGNRPAAYMLALTGSLGIPGSFLFFLSLGKYLHDPSLFLSLIWWFSCCYSPYLVFTKISKIAGYRID